jgi:hypothetical protein
MYMGYSLARSIDATRTFMQNYTLPCYAHTHVPHSCRRTQASFLAHVSYDPVLDVNFDDAVTAEEVRAVFRAMDRNHDGRVDGDDFRVRVVLVSAGGAWISPHAGCIDTHAGCIDTTCQLDVLFV